MTSLLSMPELRPTDVRLRDYQQNAIDAVRNEFARGRKSTLIVCATGVGKSVILGMIARRVAERGGRTLVLAHRGELIEQLTETLTRLGLDPGIEKADQYARALYEPNAVVATVQTMQRDRLKSWDRDYFKLIVTDECFPAGTLVDGVPIESLRVGDIVSSFSHAIDRNCVERRPIVRLFRNPARSLVRIWFGDGTSLVCTREHPIFVDSIGYVRACDLKSNYRVIREAHRGIQEIHQAQGLRGLRQDVPAEELESLDDADLLPGMQGEASGGTRQGGRPALRPVRGDGGVPRDERAGAGPQGAGVLLGGVQGGQREHAEFGADGRDQSQVCVVEDEGEQPDVAAGRASQDGLHAQGDGTQTAGPGRERTRPHGPAVDALGGITLADRGCREDGILGQGWLGLSVALQTRHRGPGTEGRHRGGRELARGREPEGAGPEEGRPLALLRVDRIEVLEPGSDGRFGGLCPDGFVYNIEVEGNHNYFADGVLVHNCHHSTADTYRNIYNHFDALHLGCTATADRADEDSLSDVFESVAFEYSMWDAMTAPEPGPYLSRLRFVQCDVGIDLRQIRTTAGDLNAADLEEAIKPHIETLANAIKQEVGTSKTLIFTPDVGSSMAMASALVSIGLTAKWVAGDSPDRKDVINGFRRGDFQVLSNCQLATEGFDVPDIEAVALCRPTKSRALYAQQVGRGTRLAPGKQFCKLIDFNWLTEKHKLVKPVELFDTSHTDSETLEIAAEMVKKQKGLDLKDVIEEAIEEKKRRTVLRIQARERQVRYRKVSYDPLAAMESLGLTVRREAASLQGTITEKQRATLEKFGLTGLEACSKRRASTLIDTLMDRARKNLCSHKQAAHLIRNGVEPEVARAMTKAEASARLAEVFGDRPKPASRPTPKAANNDEEPMTWVA